MRVAAFVIRHGETTLTAALFLGAVYGAVFCAVTHRYGLTPFLLVGAVGLFPILCTFADSDDWRALMRGKQGTEPLESE